MFIFKISGISLESSQTSSIIYVKTTLNNEKNLESSWISNAPLKVIIHGWDIESDESDSWIFNVKKGNFNSVIMNK